MIKGQTTMLLLVNFAKLVSDLVDLLVFLEFVCLSSCTVKFFCLSVITSCCSSSCSSTSRICQQGKHTVWRRDDPTETR